MIDAVKLATALMGLALPLATWAAPVQTSAGAQPVVIVELFTSEGCSSCPPADAFLQQLVSEQPVAGIQIVGLEEHVDYFDNLGWRDPFASPLFTKRQTEYDERVFRTGDVFTPQIVVDGAAECSGNDRDAARRALTVALRGARPTLQIESGPVSGDHLSVTIRVEVPTDLARHGTADVLVAVTESGLVTNVKRGENRGRTLSHGAVVRALVPVGTLAKNDRTFDGTTAVPVGAGWNRSNLRIVALVQERDTRHVLGAAAAPIR